MSDDPSPQNRPLDYETPPPSEVPRAKLVRDAIAGWLAAVITVGIAAFAAGYGGFMVGYSDHGARGAVVSATIGLTAMGLVVGAALKARRDPRRRGFQMGLWVGLGCGLLMAGLCFTKM